MISLPLQVFDFVRSPEPTMVARGFGAAAVLLALVLTLFLIARSLAARPLVSSPTVSAVARSRPRSATRCASLLGPPLDGVDTEFPVPMEKVTP